MPLLNTSVTADTLLLFYFSPNLPNEYTPSVSDMFKSINKWTKIAEIIKMQDYSECWDSHIPKDNFSHIWIGFCIRILLLVSGHLILRRGEFRISLWKIFSILGYINSYTPVFRRDVLWYGDVCPSVRPSGSPSGSPSVSHSFSHFSPTCFDILSWNSACHFSSYEHSIKFECHQFPSIFVGVMPLLELKILEIHRVFRSFLLHALTYWAEIFHMTLFFCTTDQVRVSSTSVIFVGVMPLLDLRILEIHSFPHFSLTCFDILSLNFANHFILLYYRSSSSVVNFRQFL